MNIYYEPVICFISKSDSEDALKQDTQEWTIKFFGFFYRFTRERCTDQEISAF